MARAERRQEELKRRRPRPAWVHLEALLENLRDHPPLYRQDESLRKKSNEEAAMEVARIISAPEQERNQVYQRLEKSLAKYPHGSLNEYYRAWTLLKNAEAAAKQKESRQ